MLGTPIAILAAVALLMPGFIVAELALAGSAKARRSDLELALRALAYTVVLHLIFVLDERVQPERGVYVPATQIAQIELLPVKDRGILSS
jgi:hypothetical protein